MGALFCGPLDLVGEGVDTVLRNVGERAGVERVAPAVAYHAVRDLLPHNPLHRVATGGAGVCFAPDRGRYPDPALRPAVSPFAQGRDLLGELCDRSASAGVGVDAWAVYLHDDGHDPARPGIVRNLYGDPYPELLCPADPRVRAYATALTEDLCSYPIGSVLAEAPHWLPFGHGYGHERRSVELDPTAELLLGLCFCPYCRAAAEARGVRVPDLLAAAKAHVGACLTGGPPGSARPVRDAGLGEYLDARCGRVTALITELAATAARAGVGFRLLDLSAGLLGWADGRPAGACGAATAKNLGVDPAGVAAVCPISLTPYARDPERVRAETLAYRAEAGAGARLGAVLRPMNLDCDSVENLADKLVIARDLGLDRMDFYHYGLSPLTALDRIRTARAIAADRPPAEEEPGWPNAGASSCPD
ncbi:hypothetical protein [Rhizohabitans arisaemae]|uniref:hypothetical protein n=1 Tax=Rhizohabitans arisaemae TaxID=2720610 RepID=UPI0024B1DB02|nr:hypothetical protein [Rhizohabitans arisaemae]